MGLVSIIRREVEGSQHGGWAIGRGSVEAVEDVGGTSIIFILPFGSEDCNGAMPWGKNWDSHELVLPPCVHKAKYSWDKIANQAA